MTGLRQENVLIIDSSFSFHNLKAFFSQAADAPDHWLIDTCTNPTLSAQEREILATGFWSKIALQFIPFPNQLVYAAFFCLDECFDFMITGTIKNPVDQIWNTFWFDYMSNSLSVIEQITYLLFAKRLDELHTAKEKRVGVSTEILIFTHTNSGDSDQVWFCSIQTNGFSLNEKREPIVINRHRLTINLPNLFSTQR